MLSSILNGDIRFLVLHHTESAITATVNALCEGASSWLSQAERSYYRSIGYKCDYHWLIDYEGNVFNPHPETLQTFNSGDNEVNAHSIAICCIGSYMEQRPTDKMFVSLLKTLKLVHKRYPKAVIKMHKEIVSTACPGLYYANHVYPLLIKADKMADWDVNAWSFPAIATLFYQGIVQGDKIKGKFYMRPRSTITREEAFALVYNTRR